MINGAEIEFAAAAHAGDIARAEREYIDCPWTEAQVRAEISRADSAFFVALAGGEYAGHISGTFAADECEIANIAVQAGMRRRGIGRALLERLMAEARTRGASKMFLLVRDDNAAAIALYTAAGFTAVGERRGYYGGKNAVIMMLKL